MRGGTAVPVAESAGEPAIGLRRTLVWLTPIASGFVIVDAAAFLAFRDDATAGASAIPVAVGLSLTFALFLRRGAAMTYPLGRAVSANADLAEAMAKLSEANEELRPRVEALQRQNREIGVLTEIAELLQASRPADEAAEAISRSGALLLPDAAGVVHILEGCPGS